MAQACKALLEVQDGVKHASHDVDANGKGIDVVLPDVLWDNGGEDLASEDQRYDCDADARDGCKEPDEEDEEEDPGPKVRRNVDSLELIRSAAMEAFISVREAVHTLVVAGNIEKDGATFGDADLIRSRRAHVSAIKAKVGSETRIILEGVFSIDGGIHGIFHVALDAHKNILPCSPDMVSFLVTSWLIK